MYSARLLWPLSFQVTGKCVYQSVYIAIKVLSVLSVQKVILVLPKPWTSC